MLKVNITLSEIASHKFATDIRVINSMILMKRVSDYRWRDTKTSFLHLKHAAHIHTKPP